MPSLSGACRPPSIISRHVKDLSDSPHTTHNTLNHNHLHSPSNNKPRHTRKPPSQDSSLTPNYRQTDSYNCVLCPPRSKTSSPSVCLQTAPYKSRTTSSSPHSIPGWSRRATEVRSSLSSAVRWLSRRHGRCASHHDQPSQTHTQPTKPLDAHPTDTHASQTPSPKPMKTRERTSSRRTTSISASSVRLHRSCTLSQLTDTRPQSAMAARP